MKICAWCGAENDNSALNCRGCGTSQFKSTSPVSPKSSSGDGAEAKEAVAEPPTDFARRLANVTPKAWVTPTIIGLNVLLFLILSADSRSIFSPSIPNLIAWGGNFGPLTVTHNQWWRLMSCCFIHIGLIHLLCNMYALFQAGKLTEKLFGNGFFLLIYLACGLAGSLTSVWFNPMFVSAGASGAIFGVYGALLGYMAREGRGLPSGTAKSVANGAGVFIAYNVLYGLMGAMNQAADHIINSGPNSHSGGTVIDIAAHGGGLVAGLAFGWLGARPLVAERRRALIRPRAVAMASGIFGITVLLLMPVFYSNQADIPRFTLLGGMYYRGEGVSKNTQTAITWFKQAAEQGDLNSEKLLGSIYYSGHGVGTNVEEGLRWFTKAAEQGDAESQKILAGVYLRGEGVQTNVEEGVKWLEKVGEQGDIEAQKVLASSFATGDGLPKDIAKALYWARKAAEQGDLKCAQALAGMYYKGDGVRQDKAEAAKWYLRAANQGDNMAQTMFALMCAGGEGVEKNPVQALKWLTLSGNKGEKIVAVRQELERDMTPEQKRQVEQEVQKFLRSHRNRPRAL